MWSVVVWRIVKSITVKYTRFLKKLSYFPEKTAVVRAVEEYCYLMSLDGGTICRYHVLDNSECLTVALDGRQVVNLGTSLIEIVFVSSKFIIKAYISNLIFKHMIITLRRGKF